MLRFDLIFSYWVFAWYILYITSIVDFSPKFAIYIALIASIWLMGIMAYYNTDIFDTTIFIILIFIMKLIPLFTLRKESVKLRDVYTFIIIFAIYEIYIQCNGWTFRKQRELYISFNGGKLTTPFITFLRKYRYKNNIL